MGFSDIIKKMRSGGAEQAGGWRQALGRFGTSMSSAPADEPLGDRVISAAGDAAAGAITNARKKKKLMAVPSHEAGDVNAAIIAGMQSY
jgi:hypothetical protein